MSNFLLYLLFNYIINIVHLIMETFKTIKQELSYWITVGVVCALAILASSCSVS